MSKIVKVRTICQKFVSRNMLNIYLLQAHFQEFRVPQSQTISGESQLWVRKALGPSGDGREHAVSKGGGGGLCGWNQEAEDSCRRVSKAVIKSLHFILGRMGGHQRI